MSGPPPSAVEAALVNLFLRPFGPEAVAAYEEREK